MYICPIILGPLLTLCAFNDMFTAVVSKGGAYYEDDEPQFNVFFRVFLAFFICSKLILNLILHVKTIHFLI